MPEHAHPFTIRDKKFLPKSEVEFEVSLPLEELNRARSSALRRMQERTELPGFRKGHVPERMIIEKFGEHAILEEAAELLLGETIPHVFEQEKIDAIGRPIITVLKLAVGNPFEFRLRTATVPRVELPDYKALARTTLHDVEPGAVTDSEVQTVITNLLDSRKAKNADGKEVTPELTDEFVKTLGAFGTVEEFKKILREDLAKDKSRRAIEKARAAFGEALVAGSIIDLPDILVEGELGRMLAQFRGDVEGMGLVYNEYLAKQKTTEDELKKKWREAAEKRAKLQLALHEIAKVEKITPDAAIVEREVKHLLEHHKDIDPARARAYMEMVVVNEKIFDLLSAQ